MTRATIRQVPPSDFWLRPLPVPKRRRLIRRLARWAVLSALAIASVAAALAAVQLAWWLLRHLI